MIDLNLVKQSSLTAVTRRIWVDEYWYESEVWGSSIDSSGDTLDILVWAGTRDYTNHGDARLAAGNMCKILLEEMRKKKQLT